ncbi:hypothetical protein DB88DRAFT_496619 [Papiliotrema laurentii]|uniref:Uncharacterized protein n=1 Tax=Papiliotrema laurentii TaxID=5418 RepID=A0AAD9FJU6_PAPLA|nr:hypothetical protein DB88DRAFT_496619 [Papiliotrema laurentii]
MTGGWRGWRLALPLIAARDRAPCAPRPSALPLPSVPCLPTSSSAVIAPSRVTPSDLGIIQMSRRPSRHASFLIPSGIISYTPSCHSRARKTEARS